jgi:hypothetical protein
MYFLIRKDILESGNRSERASVEGDKKKVRH